MFDDQTDAQTTDDQSQSTQGGDEHANARVAAGLPASLQDVTPEQMQQYVGQPTIEVSALNSDQTEVVAMQETANAGEEQVA